MMEHQEKLYSGIYVFEGIDNVGKSTIVRKLKEKISETLGCECVVIAFPGNAPRTLGSLVYDIHHNQTKYFELPLNETSLQLLHIASHIDLIQGKLKELNSKPSIVLLDRFWWSTYVYGSAGKLDRNIVQAILEPELMHWKDLNVRRVFLIERENRERDYEEEKDKRIVELYRDLATKATNSVIINNDGSIEETVQEIYDNIVGA